jgi:hypothetical protein
VRLAVESAVEDVRPISIFPKVDLAAEVGVGIAADLVVRGLPLPSGTRETVNASATARTVKGRLLDRVRAYVEGLGFGEPVRAAEITRTLLGEPALVDVRNLQLRAFPPLRFRDADFFSPTESAPEELGCGANVDLQASQIAVFVDDDSGLVIL